MSNLLKKIEEDAESHLFGSNDWMNSQVIAEDAKFGMLCLTWDGVAHLWHESITPIFRQWLQKCTMTFLLKVLLISTKTVWWGNR